MGVLPLLLLLGLAKDLAYVPNKEWGIVLPGLAEDLPSVPKKERGIVLPSRMYPRKNGGFNHNKGKARPGHLQRGKRLW